MQNLMKTSSIFENIFNFGGENDKKIFFNFNPQDCYDNIIIKKIIFWVIIMKKRSDFFAIC